MTYLLDTNIWLERLLDRERAPEVARLLDQVPTDELSMTDFSLHSIGVILSRLHHADALVSFVQDVVIDGAVEVIALAPADMSRLVETRAQRPSPGYVRAPRGREGTVKSGPT